MPHYLVTGATGVVGSALVPRLLVDHDNICDLLIRGDDEAAASARLDGLFNFWQWPTDDPRRRRVRAIRGDVAQPRLGLSGHDLARLAGSITHVIHAAGVVKLNRSIDEARHHAIDGLSGVLELIDAARSRTSVGQPFIKLDYLSTVGIGGRMKGELPERRVTQVRSFHNTYEQAKAEAEDLLWRRIDGGLPATIHRPSMVVGDSATGRVIHYQVFYHLCEFLSGGRSGGWLPDLRGARLDIIPSDTVAAALAAAARDPATIGRVLHLASGPERSLRLDALAHDLSRRFAPAGRSPRRPRRLPTSCWYVLAAVLGRVGPRRLRRAFASLPYFLDYLAEPQAFANRQTVGWMATHGISIPEPGAYLDVILDAYRRDAKRG